MATGPPAGYGATISLEVMPVNEDVFNMDIRKFLKVVGVTSQREIETMVRDAIAAGRLKGHETLKAKVVLTLDGVGLSKTIEGEIKLG